MRREYDMIPEFASDGIHTVYNSRGAALEDERVDQHIVPFTSGRRQACLLCFEVS